MRYYGGFAACMLTFVLVASGLSLIILRGIGSVYVNIAVSVFFSIVVPAAFLLTRNQVRSDRVHTAEVFRRTFDGALSSNSYFEFLQRKYYTGIPSSGAGDVTRRYNGVSFPRKADWFLLGSSLPFVIFTAFGVFIIVMPSQDVTNLFTAYAERADSIGAGLAASIQKNYDNIIVLASLAFASSFLYSLRLFFKSLATYSPVPIVFLRAFAHMLFSVMLAVMIWRVAPESAPFTNIAIKVQNSIDSGSKVTPKPGREEVREPQAGAMVAK